MSAPGSLGERLRLGTIAEAVRALEDLAAQFTAAAEWISKNVQRTNESIAFVNLLTACASYLETACGNIEAHISVLAMISRSLYEVNLQVRDIVDSHDGILRWQAEAVADKIQIFEGMLKLTTVNDMASERAGIRTKIERLKSLRDKHGLPDVKPKPSGNLARSVGLFDEHEALFKLYSKLVHPSSFLINDHKTAASDEIRIILQVQAQLYACDTLSRICNAVSMPKTES